MDYKELISKFRSEADCIRKHNMIGWADGYDLAADAIETLLAERDAAVERMHGKCVECKYGTKYPWNPPCHRCIFSGNDNCSKDYWEWRGLKKGDAQ